jgi:hypothetical protein
MKIKLPTTLKQIIALTAAGLFTGSIAFAGTIVVTPGSMDGWAFYSTDSSGTVGTGSAITGMVNGPATPPLGSGSAHLETGPGAGDGSAQLRNSSYVGTSLASLTALSYSTYATAWNDSQLPWLRLYVAFNGDVNYDDRLVFEPTYSSSGAGNGDPSPQPSVLLNTWQSWDVLNGMVYSDLNGGPGSSAITFAQYLLDHPTATIVSDNGQGIGGIRLTAGLASAGNNFDTYVDDFTIGTAAGTTTYDFELTPSSAPDTGATVMLLGFALAGLSAFRRWKITS